MQWKESTMPMLTNLAQHVTERRQRTAMRREHDDAISDTRVAVEHAAAIDRQVLRGEQGCMFCR